MTSAEVVQLILQVGVIPALFVWLLMYMMAEHKKDKEDSRKREDALMEHIKKSDATQEGIMKSIERISEKTDKIQLDVEILKTGR